MGSKASKVASSTEKETPIVCTQQGQIRGRLLRCGDTNAAQFLGVPFAQPPLGELRFRKPQPPLPWNGIRDAQKFAPQCTQTVMHKLPGMLPNSEDCLYLNVFAPATVSSPTRPCSPVMVFIHGGAFVLGNAKMADPVGICTNFVIPHQIVMVVIQYRLGIFGFYSTGDDACDDNIGLWDQTMALQWIQENIGAFGGDKGNVTLFGQSAGGISVDLLALSPHSRDLFHKLIPMSGNSRAQKALDKCVERCTEIAHKLGIHTTDTKKRIELLRKLPASKLTISIDEFGMPPLGALELLIGPRIDGQFFPKSLDQLRAEAPLKPCIVGLCQMEGAMFMACAPDKNYSLSLLEKFIAREFAESEYPNNFVRLRADALKMFIGNGDADTFAANKRAVTRSIAEILSDQFVGIASQQLANEHIARGNQHFYLYSFDHCNTKVVTMIGLFLRSKIPVKEATHGTETGYFFNSNPKCLLKNEDRKLTQIACKLWANFAKYGDPNGPEGNKERTFCWEPVNAERPSQYLSIKPEPEMRVDGFQDGRPMRWLQLKNKF